MVGNNFYGRNVSSDPVYIPGLVTASVQSVQSVPVTEISSFPSDVINYLEDILFIAIYHQDDILFIVIYNPDIR